VAVRTALTPLLLDTHAWVWWVTRPERLSRKQRTAIDRARRAAREPILVSIISCFEVALLAQRGKLRFSIAPDAWLEQAASLPGVEPVPLSLATISIAVRLAGLRDPADQLVVASALERGARLVTSDTRIAETGAVTVVA
jgi:PIN domain nuclease of toxin-antitoxin system